MSVPISVQSLFPVQSLVSSGYHPRAFYEGNAELRAVVDWVGSNYFTPDEPQGVLQPLHDDLVNHDPFLVLADYQSNSDCQERVNHAFRDRARWARMAILNTARVGKFSSDRTIAEYARDIWKAEPVRV